MPQVPVSGEDGRPAPAPGHPLRVGLVCGRYDPRRDGVSHYTRNLAAALGAQGIEATVIASSRSPGDSETDRIGTNWRLWDLRWVIHQLRRLRIVPIGANVTSWPDPLNPGPTTGDAIDERGEARSEGQANRLVPTCD